MKGAPAAPPGPWAQSKAIPWGPVDVIAGLSVRQAYDDNVFFSSLQRVGSFETFILPSVQFARRYRQNLYSLGYALRSSTYWSAPNNDFVDHYFRGASALLITRRNRLDIDANFTLNHNRLGTAFTQGPLGTIVQHPDRYRQFNTNWKYLYGLPTARGNLALEVGYLDRVYENNLERTRFLDRQDVLTKAAFLYRAAPKTRLLLEFENLLVRYDNPRPLSEFEDSSTIDTGVIPPGQEAISIDSDIRKYLLGAIWQQTAQTTGEVRIGYVQQDFVAPQLKDFGDFTANVAVTWKPLSYTSFQLKAIRDVIPTSAFGSTTFVEEIRLGWIHSWDERLSTTVTALAGRIDYVDSPVSYDIYDFGISLNYRQETWLGFSLAYSYQDRTSADPGFGFTRNLIMLTASVNPASLLE